MKKRGAALLAAVLILGGCAERTVPASAEARASSVLSGAAVSKQAAPKEDAHTMLRYKGDGAVWNSDGTLLAVDSGNTIIWVGLDNQAAKTVSYGVCGTENLRLCLGATRLLRIDERTRLLRRDGKWMLANAAIYDLDGKLLRKLPDAGETEIAGAPEKYEKNTYRLEAQWLDDTHVALHTESLLAILDSESGDVTPVDDYRTAKRQGYSMNMSSNYGIWGECADSGYYYYRATGDVPNPNPVRQLFRVDAAGNKELLSGQKDFWAFEARDGILMAVSEREDAPADQSDPAWSMNILYAQAENPVLKVLTSANCHWKQVQNEGRYLSYINDDRTKTPPMRGFYRFDTQTGQTVSFFPQTLENRVYSEGVYSFGLVGTRETESGAQFLYVIADVIEKKDPVTGEVSDARMNTALYCYDAAKNEKKLLFEHANDISDKSFNPQRTHTARRDDGQYYVMPLA